MLVGIQEEILRLNSLGLLNSLLKDKTTGTNIVWATDAYQEEGKGYERDREISVSKITGDHASVIKNRVRKELEQQSDRTRAHAEVFTPLWVCRKMNDHIDEVWFGRSNVFRDEKGVPTEKVEFPEGKTWKEYVDSRRMEIACGEAPFLVSRYNVSTGEILSGKDHVGILDRKLRVVTENARTKDEWLRWTIRAFESTYGYEFQGDNVLIARINLLLTFEEYLRARWERGPERSEYRKIINVIAWNIWQMDGLTGMTPRATGEHVQLLLPGYSEGTSYRQMDLFDDTRTFDSESIPEQRSCQIFDWRSRRNLKFSDLSKMKKKKFDFIIGNPPYQEEVENNGRKNPIYSAFIDGAYQVGTVVELITPARFLSNAGQTRKKWNRKMLDDPHLKTLFYEQDGSKVFPNTDIKGGVVITYRDEGRILGPIGVFFRSPELKAILESVKKKEDYKKSLADEIVGAVPYRFTQRLVKEHPECVKSLRKSFDLRSNVFEIEALRGTVFFDDKSESPGYVKIVGKKRTEKWIARKYIEVPENFNRIKVFLPESNGSGAFGEALSVPKPGGRQVGCTQTFISIGKNFKTNYEANSCIKYIKSKFARTMLGILKVTQHNPRDVWQYVPLQDFTKKSDIDWSKSVREIDQQLYKKYGLKKDSIKFIEEHVAEMK